MSKQLYVDFDQYIRQGEPDKREKAYAWSTAIGLQAVDGLQTSEYLLQTAQRHIEGEILKKSMPWAILYIVISGLMVYFLV